MAKIECIMDNYSMQIVRDYPVFNGTVSANQESHAKRYDVCLVAFVDDASGNIVDVRFMGRALVATADGNKGFDIDCPVDFAASIVRNIDEPARKLINGKNPNSSKRAKFNVIPLENETVVGMRPADVASIEKKIADYEPDK